MKLPVIKKNQWFAAVSGALIVIIIVLLLFPVKNSSDYRKSVKILTIQRDSLKSVLSSRDKKISDLTTTVQNSEMKLDTVNFVNSILSNKLKKYEKDFILVNTMSIDDNIEFLSRYLSAEAGN